MKLGKTDRDNVFDAIRREGILEYNKQETLKNPDNPRFQRERKRPENCKDSSVVMCNICHAFIEKKYRYRHEQVHNDKSDAAIRVTPIPVSLLSRDVETGSKSTTDSDYTTEVLSRFRMDEVGRKCVSDKLLVEVGKTMWYKVKSKKDKKVEVRKQVMTDIRRIAILHLHLQDSEDILGKLPEKEGTIIDLFKRSNFKHLQEAIDKHTTSGSDLKAGLKIALYYLLKSTSKILTGMFLINDEDDQADDISRFVTVLEMHQHLFFGDATYQQNKNREEKLRCPQEQPLEEDVQAVRSYSLQRMAELENEVLDSHTFIELRNIVVCRLVLFNARRGGEPTRLFIKDWEEADSNAWLDKRHVKELDAIDACLAKNLKVGYQSGKGKHLVPTLFPKDTHKAIGMLANNDVRQASGIASQNSYLFPSGNDSLEHVSGWHAVNAVSDKCSLVDKDLLTATRNRHRVSTEFAMMDVPPSEREFVYRHLGHSENTNVHVYQAPLAVREWTVVGRRLQDLDKAGEDDASEPAEVESEADGTFQPAAACTEEAEDAASHSVGVEEGENASKRGVRRYTHWSKECNKKTCEYFLKFIMGEASKKLPGKQEVEEFLKQNPDFPIKDWMIIRSKIMNEKRKREKKVKQLTEIEL